MNMDAHDMVRRLQAAEGSERELVLGELYAERVEFRHVPPDEHDGSISRRSLVGGATWERELFQREIRGYATTHQYEVAGDGIVETYRMEGTLPDGEPLDSTMTITYTVSDGAITVMRATAALREVIEGAGGFPGPPRATA